MTKTALSNLERRSREAIAAKDRYSRELIAHKDRAHKSAENQLQREHERRENSAKNMTTIGSASIGAAGRMVSAFNDPAWYTKFVPLKEFANLPTYERLGSSSYEGLLGTGGRKRAGIMVLPYWNVIGNSPRAGASSPINQILMRSKEMVLKLNSRSNVQWEAGDLGYNFIATGSIITLLAEIKRCIEVYRTYRGDNAYLAQVLIESLGFTYADIDANYAEYRKKYSILARRFNSAIVAPADLSYFARKCFLASNIFVDHRSGKFTRQMYIPRTHDFHTLSSDGTTLTQTVIQVTSAYYSLSQYFMWVESAIQSITENPDFIEMYADLRAAFGNNLVTVPEELEDEIHFNDHELNRLQIHNIKTLPVCVDGTGNVDELIFNSPAGEITQDSDGYIVQGPSSWYKFTIPANVHNALFSGGTFTTYGADIMPVIKTHYDASLLDSVNDDVSSDEVIDVTRGCFAGLEYAVDNGYLKFITRISGTEIFSCGIITYINGAGQVRRTIFGSVYIPTAINNFACAAVVTRNDALLSDFDWAPESFYLKNASEQDLHFEMYHAFPINAKSLERLHEAAVLSEFYLSGTTFNGSGR